MPPPTLPVENKFRRLIKRTIDEEKIVWTTLWKQVTDGADVCDVTLKLKDESIKAHWCVLLTVPYFSALYSSGLQEIQSRASLDMTFASGDIMTQVLKYIYIGTIELTSDNMKEVLRVADYLQLDNLKNTCSRYLQIYCLKVENCVSMCVYASMYNLESLYTSANEKMRANLDKVFKSDEMLQLSSDSLRQLITDESLHYLGSGEFYDVLVRWTESDMEKRAPEFPRLFCLLKLKDIPFDVYNSDVKNYPLVLSNGKCIKMVQEFDQKIQSGEYNPLCETKAVAILAGGNQNTDPKSRLYTSECYGYVIEDNRWISLPNLNRPMKGDIGVSETNGKTYFYGREQFSEQYYCSFMNNDNPDDLGWVRAPSSFPTIMTEQILATTVCGNKFVSFRLRDNKIIAVIFDLHGESSQKQTIELLNNITFSLEYLRLCAYKNNQIFVYISFTMGKKQPSQKCRFLSVEIQPSGVAKHRMIKGPMTGGILMYKDCDTIYLETPGHRFSQAFDITTSKWSECRRGLPSFPNPAPKHYMYLAHDNDLFVFGGVRGAVKSDQAFKISRKGLRTSHTWVAVKKMPHFFINSACALVHLPKSQVRCAYNCPHCTMKPRTTQRYDYTDSDMDEIFADSDSWVDEDDDGVDDFPGNLLVAMLLNRITGLWNSPQGDGSDSDSDSEYD